MTSLLLLLAQASAAELSVGGYVGHYAAPAGAPMPADSSLGGRLRLLLADRWALEAAVGGFEDALDPRLEVQYFLDADRYAPVRGYLAAGAGVMVYDYTGHDLWEAGPGVQAQMFPVMDFRADLRYRVVRTPRDPEGWDKLSEGGFYAAAGFDFHAPRVRPPPPPPPDTDGDGFLDPNDGCPTQPEDADLFQDQDGCPDPDNDGDGVLDVADACVNDAEDLDQFEDENGCPDPDNDQDRILDAVDVAPNQPETYNGFQDKDGAPDELPPEVKKFSGRIEGIKFDTGKATIRRESNKVLDEAATVLLAYPELRLEVQGHTDDVGDDAKNLDLSQRRAQAVVDYLVKKGVALERLVPKGYGESKPEVPNDSSANRQKNRRVEFILLKD